MSDPPSSPSGTPATSASAAAPNASPPDQGPVGPAVFAVHAAPVGSVDPGSPPPPDPISLLRRFHLEERLDDVKEFDGRIFFVEENGKSVWWPSDVRTRFRVRGSQDDDRYSLSCIAIFVKAISSVEEKDGQEIRDFIMNRNVSKTKKRIADPSDLRAMTPHPKISKSDGDDEILQTGPPTPEVPDNSASSPEPNEQAGSHNTVQADVASSSLRSMMLPPKVSKLEEEKGFPTRSSGGKSFAMEEPDSVSAPEPDEKETGCSHWIDEEPRNAVQLQKRKNKKKVEANVDHFSGLPNEVIMKILSYLELEDIAARVFPVSRRFKDLCSTWTKLKLPDEDRLDTDAAMAFIESCTLLKELDYPVSNEMFEKGGRNDSTSLAICALKSCPGLEELVVCSKRIPGDFFLTNNVKKTYVGLLLKTIGDYGHSLREFELYGRWCPKVLISNAKCLANLTHVTLYWRGDAAGAGFRSLKSIADHCKRLEHVSLFNIGGRAGEDFNYFLEGVKGTLKHLFLGGHPELTDASLKNLQKCKKLETLELEIQNYPPSLVYGGLFLALSELTELRVLKIAFCRTQYLSGKLLLLLKRLKNLTDLEIDAFFADEDLKAIADNCSELASLKFYGSEVTNEGLDHLLLKCRKLTTLRMLGRYKCLPADAFRNIQPSLRKLIVNRPCFGTDEQQEQEQIARLEALHPGLEVDVY